MRRTLVSRRLSRGVSIVVCTAALAVSLSLSSVAFAETSQDGAFGKSSVASDESPDGVSVTAGADDLPPMPAESGVGSDGAGAEGVVALDVGDADVADAPDAELPDAPDSNASAKTNGWATGADGVRHWYDDGVMAADKAFFDPGTDAWYWADADGSIACNKDVFIPVSNEDRTSGKWVRFDEQSRMVKGEDYRYGGWYFFDEVTGEMAKGFRFVEADGGKWVCYDRVTGQMYHGQASDSGHWYLFDEYTGATKYGFQYIAADNKWVFYDRITGIMLYGEQAIDGNWYYLDPYTGAVDYGWSYIPTSNKWVYFDTTTGVMLYGWQAIDGEWYWLDPHTGASDYAQVLRWKMRTASGEIGINFFNEGTCSQEAFDTLMSASSEFWGNGYALGYVMMDLNTGKGICSNIDYTFHGASSVKAPYCMSLVSRVLGFDASAAGDWYDVMHEAISWSSNEDYLSLRAQFGFDVFCDWLDAAGVGTSIGSKSWPGYTPRELAKMWLQMYSDMGKGSGGAAVQWFASSSIHSAIREAVGDRSLVCSKPGWVPEGDVNPSINDAGVVYSEDGAYLVVMMSNAPDHLGNLTDVAAALDAVHRDMVR